MSTPILDLMESEHRRYRNVTPPSEYKPVVYVSTDTQNVIMKELFASDYNTYSKNNEESLVCIRGLTIHIDNSLRRNEFRFGLSERDQARQRAERYRATVANVLRNKHRY